MKNFLIYCIIGFFLISCDKDTKNINATPPYFFLNVVIKKKGVFSEKGIQNPSSIDRKTPSKYKVVYEELDDVGIKIIHINEAIGYNMWFKILPYGLDLDKNEELVKNHTQRKFRLTLYEEDKILLSKIITITAEKFWIYKELKVDNMDYVENLNKDNSADSLIFNLTMKN